MATPLTAVQRGPGPHADHPYARGLGLSSIGYWAADNSKPDELIKDWSIDKGTAADVYTAAYMAGMLTSYPVIVP